MHNYNSPYRQSIVNFRLCKSLKRRRLLILSKSYQTIRLISLTSILLHIIFIYHMFSEGTWMRSKALVEYGLLVRVCRRRRGGVGGGGGRVQQVGARQQRGEVLAGEARDVLLAERPPALQEPDVPAARRHRQRHAPRRRRRRQRQD